MSIEQKKLLCEIAEWHMKEFYNRMEDHWTTANFNFDSECIEMIDKLETEYKLAYGALPEWETINSVQDTLSQLKKELGELT